MGRRTPLMLVQLLSLIAVATALSSRNARAQPTAALEMMEASIFDATDHRHDSSMLARSLFSVATKFSQFNVFTVVDLNATDIEMKAAMQSGKTVAMFVAGHGGPDGTMVDGNGLKVSFEVFTTAPSSSVRFIECAGCNGEKIAQVYAVPPGVHFRHGRGSRPAHELIGALNVFPENVEGELRNQSSRSAAQVSTHDPFTKAYPKGDLYVLEKASVKADGEGAANLETGRETLRGTILDGPFYYSIFAKAARAGYRVLIYRGDSYEAVANYALSQNRVAGLLLHGPAVERPSNLSVVYVSSELSEAEKSFAQSETASRSRKINNSIDNFLASVVAKRGAVIGFCEQLFISKRSFD